MLSLSKPKEMDDTDREANGTDETRTADSNDGEIAVTKASGDPMPSSNNDGEPVKKKRVPLRQRLARLKRRKAVDDEDALFGRSVAALVDGERLNPQLMWLLRILEVEGPTAVGIFRRSSNANVCRTVKAQLNSGIESDQVSVYVASTLLKELLRCLPDCLLCCDKYDQWLERVQDRGHLQRMVNDLPQCNRLLLSHVIRVLYAIHRNSSVTKMTSGNLAVCVGPSLLWSRKATLDSQKADVPRVVAVVQGLIEDAESIFGRDFLELVQDSATEQNTREPDTMNEPQLHDNYSSRDQLDDAVDDDDTADDTGSENSETRDRHVVSTDNDALGDSGSNGEEEEGPDDGGSVGPPVEGDNSIAGHPCVKEDSPKTSAGDPDDCEASVNENEAAKRRQFTRRYAIRRILGELVAENKHSSNDDDDHQQQQQLGFSDGTSFDPPPSPMHSEPLNNKSRSPVANFAKVSEHQSEGTKQKFFADSTAGSNAGLKTCEEPKNADVSSKLSKVKSYESVCSNNRSVNGATDFRQRRGMTGKGSDLFPGVFLSDTFRLKSAQSWSLNELDHEMNSDAGKRVSNRNVRPCGSMTLDGRAVESDLEKAVCYDSDLCRRKFERCDGRQWDSDIGETSSMREGRVDKNASGLYRSHVNTATKFSSIETSTPDGDQSAAKQERSNKDIKSEDTKAIESRCESSGTDRRGKGVATSKPAEARDVTTRPHEPSISSSSSDDDQMPLKSNRYEHSRANRMKQSREDIRDSHISTDQSIQTNRFRSKSDSNTVFITRLSIQKVEPLSDRRKARIISSDSSSSDSSSEDQQNQRIDGRGENLNPIEGNCGADVTQTTDNLIRQNLIAMLSAIPARSRKPVAMNNDPTWYYMERVSTTGNNTDGAAPTRSGGRHGKSVEEVFREEPAARTRTNLSSDLSTLFEPDLAKHNSNVVEAFPNGAWPKAKLVIKRKNELEAKKSPNTGKISHSTQNQVLAHGLDHCNSSSPVGAASAKKSGALNEKERIPGGRNLANKDANNFFPAAKRVPSIKGSSREGTSGINSRTNHPNAKTNDASLDGQLPSRTFDNARRSQHTGNPVARDLRAIMSQPQKIRLPESTTNSASPSDKTESRRTVSRSASLNQPKTPSIRLPTATKNNPPIYEVSSRTRPRLRTHRDLGQTTKSRDLANPVKVSPEFSQSQPLTGIGDVSGTTTHARAKPLGRQPSKSNADGPRLRPIRPSPFASARSIEIPQENRLLRLPQTLELLEGSSGSKRQESSTKSDAKRQNPIAQTANTYRQIHAIPRRTPKIPVKH